MASDNPFVRGSPQRNSHNNIVSRGTNQVEYARQKALQAADLYHNTVVGRGDTGGVVKSSPSVPAPSYTSYAARQNDKKTEDSRQGHHPATPTSDAYYKQKLRSGFIDLRNSYSEKRKPRNAPPYRAGVNDTSLGFQRSGKINEGQHKDIKPYGQTRNLGERRGLYRSNSSLELENMEYATQESTSPLRRDYGSTSSLDMIGISNETNSFFQMLQDYRNENWDQRAPAPPQMQDLLQPRSPTERSHPRVKTSLSAGNFPSKSQPYQEIGKVSNGNVTAEEEGSPKLKSKSQKSKDRKGRNKSVVSEGSGGLFKKLRGGGATIKDDVETGRPPESSALAEANDLSQEEKLRKKSVSHFDCQSLMFNLTEYIRERTQNVEGKMSRKNRTTGASAASGNQHSEESEQTDAGDGKSNDLVYSCPFFRNEVGGEEERTICLNRKAAQKRVQHLLSTVHMQKEALIKRPACNGISCLDSTASGHGVALLSICSYRGLVLEFADHGALYYRSYFRDSEHQNFFGVEDSVGPLAISLKREKLNDDNMVSKTDKKTDMSVLPGVYQYRFIVRTSQLHTLRGSILEDVIPSTVRATASRGIPPKDVLEYLLPELNLSCLRVANGDDKTAEQLVKLDEQGVTRHYKFGVKYCRAGQSSEEEMYNNEHGSAVFEEFLDCIGRRVQLQGFDKYRGGLDCKCNSTGTHSLFAEFLDYEIMFHVSTLLPFTANNKQQLLRKRHIGNDIVTIVFQEPGSLPFTPKSVRSHFQHVFIIVRAHVSADSHSVKYSIAVSRSKDVPPFGPPIPDGALFTKGPEFAEFLLTKAMNAENAVHKSDKFTMMAVRTRAEYLKDLATNHVSSATLESTAKISKFSLSTKKKERGRNRSIPDSNTRGAVAWNLQVEDFGSSSQFDGILAIAMDTLVIVEEESKEVVFYCPTKAIIGWTSQTNSLRLYYDHGECVAVSSSPDDIQEVVNRLYVVSSGCETVEMALRRNTLGQLGFHVHFEGIVSDVEQYGFAWQTGLRAGCRLVEVCKVAMATLTHDQMIDLLRTSNQVKVVMIPAYPDGTPRSGVDELRSSHAAFLAQCTTSQTDSPDYSSDSSRSTVTGGAANRSVTDPRYLSPSSGGSVNYSDLRTMSSYLDSKSYQSAVEQKASTSVSHNYTSSHDSTGTRSSGHGSEGVAHGDTTHRPDNLSSEGFVSGGDSLERERSQQNTAATYGGYSGQVKGYTPYGKDLHSQLAGGEVTSWPSQLPTSSSLDYVSSKNPPPPRSTGFSNLAPRPYVNPTAKDSRTTSYITMADVTATRHKGRDEPAKETKVETYSKSTRFDLSPRSNTENTQQTNMNPSDDSRHRSNPQRKTSTPSGGKHGGSSHFEEDLKRLINPDISFTDTDEKPLHLTQYTRSPRPRQRLLRTLSDESMCGTLPRDKVTRHKVKDTTDTQLRPTTLESRVGGSQPLNKSSPNIPLPEDGADWTALVDTATKAFPQGSRESTEAIGSNEEVTVRDATHSPASQTSTAKTTGSWGRGDSSKSDKIEQLEKRVTQLEKQLEKERREKADLETEVSRLRRDNVQLQEESQTAAAQLRKFTEWFFQTIDRQ